MAETSAMADTPEATRRSPLQGWEERFAAIAPAIEVAEIPFLPMVNLRVAPGTLAGDAVERALGATLPRDPSRVALSHIDTALTIVWLAPDEFLLLGGSHPAGEVVATLRDALVSTASGAAVDVSAQRTLLSVAGAQSRDLLAGGCSADLAEESAPSGTSVQTLLAQAGVIIIVTDAAAGSFILLVRSSFGEYVANWILQAAREYV